MTLEVVQQVTQAIAESALGRAVASIRADGGIQFALGNRAVRALTADEIALLEKQGNTADEWPRIRVADGFDARRVQRSTFHGDVVLGRFDKAATVAEGLEVPSGVYQSTVANCTIGHNTLVRDVKLLANCVVAEDCVLHDCGRVVCEGTTTFGNGLVLSPGIEGGGRELPVYAEITIGIAATIGRSRARSELLQQFGHAVAEYAERVRSSRGILERNATVRGTPLVKNSYLGPNARIDGATEVSECTVLSNAEEPTTITSGACVREALLQWGTSVATMALVCRSVLCEHSHVEEHGKVTGSLIGPNTGIAKGEVIACLLGPFVGFHHQALLIAAFWPEGRGNVSYGANVGSNHTSKAPDQEFWPGEGAFLGLGVNIKYPSNFTEAPYTIVACGLTTLPQKLAFPFSLINKPSVQPPGVVLVFNEIVPAWFLSDNLYALKRNEGKYQARNRARRTRFDFAVFRPEIVDLVSAACRRLEQVKQRKDAYTESDIDGLGKNFLLEANRLTAIEAYRFFIRHYGLLGLKEQVQAAVQANRLDGVRRLLDTPSALPRWEHQRRILKEYLEVADVASALNQLASMFETIARAVEKSRAKDDSRGRRIIPDYADVHSPAAEDRFVCQTWDETRAAQAEIQALLGSLTALRDAQWPSAEVADSHAYSLPNVS